MDHVGFNREPAASLTMLVLATPRSVALGPLVRTVVLVLLPLAFITVSATGQPAPGWTTSRDGLVEPCADALGPPRNHGGDRRRGDLRSRRCAGVRHRRIGDTADISPAVRRHDDEPEALRPDDRGGERLEPLGLRSGVVGIVVEEGGPAAPEPDDLVPVVRDAVHEGLDAGVEPRHVAAAGQDPDPHRARC